MRVVFLCSAMLVAATPAVAQAHRFELTPRVGWFVPTQWLTSVPTSPPNDDLAVLLPGPAVAVDLDADLPVPLLDVRGGVAYVASTLAAKRDQGLGSCGPNCHTTIYEVDRVADASMLVATVAAVMRLRFPVVQPYLAAGGGIKHYRFAQEDFQEEEFREAFPDDPTHRTLQLAAGADVDVWRLRIRLDGNYYASVYDTPPREGYFGTMEDDDMLQGDVLLTLGIWLHRF